MIDMKNSIIFSMFVVFVLFFGCINLDTNGNEDNGDEGIIDQGNGDNGGVIDDGNDNEEVEIIGSETPLKEEGCWISGTKATCKYYNLYPNPIEADKSVLIIGIQNNMGTFTVLGMHATVDGVEVCTPDIPDANEEYSLVMRTVPAGVTAQIGAHCKELEPDLYYDIHFVIDYAPGDYQGPIGTPMPDPPYETIEGDLYTNCSYYKENIVMQ